MKYKVQFFKDSKWYTWCIMAKQEWAKDCEEILKQEKYKTRILSYNKKMDGEINDTLSEASSS